MASTMRSVDTRFWTDTWVRKLNALDRYVFLYFLTNDHSSWCGVYELDIAMAAFETGIDEVDLRRSILPRLKPKIIYIDGWVYVKNFGKYHSQGSDDTKKAIDKAWSAVPEKVRLKIREIEDKWGDPKGGGVGVSPSAFALSSAFAPSERGDTPSEKSITYLKNIPKQDIDDWTKRFITSEVEIKNKGESLFLYCKSKAKTYRDYKSFLLNAIKKDFKERSNEVSKYSSIKTNIAQT